VNTYREMCFCAYLSRHGRIVKSYANGAAMVTVVLPYDALAAQLPEPGIVIRACRDQISRVCTEGAVPDPALVTM
jgi:hypothetical protein